MSRLRIVVLVLGVLNILAAAVIVLVGPSVAGLSALHVADTLSELERAGIIDHVELKEYREGGFGDDALDLTEYLVGRSFTQIVKACLAIGIWLIVNGCVLLVVCLWSRQVERGAGTQGL